jgi:hypothetical protein
MSGRPFSPPLIELNQALKNGGSQGGGGLITRRQLLKRGGGATVATLVAFNLGERARAFDTFDSNSGGGSTTPPPFPGCYYTICRYEPVLWGDTVDSDYTPSAGDIVFRVQWWLGGTVKGQFVKIPTPLPYHLGATVTVFKAEADIFGYVNLEQIDHIPSTVVNQSAVCDTQCNLKFLPGPHSDALVFSNSGDSWLKLKLRSGVVTQIEASHSSGAKYNVFLAGLDWTFSCL